MKVSGRDMALTGDLVSSSEVTGFQKSSPCSWMTDVPIFLIDVNQLHALDHRGHLVFATLPPWQCSTCVLFCRPAGEPISDVFLCIQQGKTLFKWLPSLGQAHLLPQSSTDISHPHVPFPLTGTIRGMCTTCGNTADHSLSGFFPQRKSRLFLNPAPLSPPVHKSCPTSNIYSGIWKKFHCVLEFRERESNWAGPEWKGRSCITHRDLTDPVLLQVLVADRCPVQTLIRLSKQALRRCGIFEKVSL